VKNITSETTLTLEEAYAGAMIIETAMKFRIYRIDWTTFILLPGDHVVNGLSVFAGQAFTAMDRSSVHISEKATTPTPVFLNWGENRLSNVTVAPTVAFGSVDGLARPQADIWAGAESVIDNCTLEILNYGSHAGGNVRLPYLNGGRSIIKNTIIRHDEGLHFFGNDVAGAVTATNYNTRVDIIDCMLDVIPTIKSLDAGASFAFGSVHISRLGTFNLKNILMTQEENYVTPFAAAGDVGSIWVNQPAIVNLNNVRSNVSNKASNGVRTSNVLVDDAAEVNITHCDLEASGTSGTSIYCNHASAVINVRHSRIKGSSNSINNIAGTVNAAGSVTTIGATAGIITATET
jgi:hypothetical protein